MKTYTDKDIQGIFKQQKYKYASLKNSDGKSIVTYNTESNPKITAQHKLNESFERLKILPDGVYYFCFANSKGRNVQPDEFQYVKGNVATDEKGTQLPYQIINQLPSNLKPNESDKVLSYQEVLKNQIELTRVTFERDSYKRELETANKTITELEAEIKELEGKANLSEDPNTPAKWIENLSTTALPIFDRFMSYKEKELNLRERFNSSSKQNVQARKRKTFTMPEIGSESWDKWMDNLAAMEEDKFNQTLEAVKKLSVPHYDAIVLEFSEDELEESEETE